MCGILGVVGGRAAELSARMVEHALCTVRHRGPDDEGYLFHDAATSRSWLAAGQDTDRSLAHPRVADGTQGFDVAFGHRRLSILDVTPAGHQPMASVDGTLWLTFNGEVYNFIELRRELEAKGHAFRTGTDTEVILAAYREWGAGMLPRFTGMFALALLDTAQRRVLVARDPFGIKPLYWRRVGSAFAFSSEITPLLALEDARPKADVHGLYQYLRFGLTDGFEGTMFEAVRQLPAAHYLVLDLDGAVVEPPTAYWTPGQVPRRRVSLDDAVAELRHLLDESVRLHLRSDVPLGTCLSGGLDSTAIVAYMRKQLGPDAPIHAFSFESDDPRTGEGPYVEIAARAFGLTRHATSPSAADLVADLDTLIRLQEQPFDTTSIYAQYRVFKLAHDAGVTVVLDGQGSDELFGGYQTAISAQLGAAITTGHWGAARALARSPHVGTRAAQRRLTMSAMGRLVPRPLLVPFMRAVGEPLYPSWMDRDWFGRHHYHAEPRAQGRGRDALREELLHFTQLFSLPRLLRYEDRNSMAFSIESRVPFCTTAMADFALSLPPELLVAPDGETKSVLRRAMIGVVPQQILDRPKVGFETPEREWLATLRPWIDETLASETFRALPFIDHAQASRTIAAQLDGAGRLSPAVWHMLNVSAWASRFDVRF